jgi:integrase
MADLRGREGISARALEFLTLTAARTNEVTGARESEFDLTAKIWTIPAERMKAERDEVRRVVGTPDAEDAALFVQFVVIERIGRQHVPIPSWRQ